MARRERKDERETDPIGGVETMAMPQRDETIEVLKRPAKWSAEAFGEGGYEVVPPEKEEAFRKMAEEENRRRRPGMYAAAQYYGKSVKGGRSAVRLAGKMVGAHFSEDDKMVERNCNLKRTRRFFETDEIVFTQEECTRL